MLQDIENCRCDGGLGTGIVFHRDAICFPEYALAIFLLERRDHAVEPASARQEIRWIDSDSQIETTLAYRSAVQTADQVGDQHIAATARLGLVVKCLQLRQHAR